MISMNESRFDQCCSKLTIKAFGEHYLKIFMSSFFSDSVTTFCNVSGTTYLLNWWKRIFWIAVFKLRYFTGKISIAFIVLAVMFLIHQRWKLCDHRRRFVCLPVSNSTENMWKIFYEIYSTTGIWIQDFLYFKRLCLNSFLLLKLGMAEVCTLLFPYLNTHVKSNVLSWLMTFHTLYKA